MRAHWMNEAGTLAGAIEVPTLHAEGVLYDSLDTEPARYQTPLASFKEL